MDTGIGLIENERMRQVLQEGYDAEHDSAHIHGELAHAGAAYAFYSGCQTKFNDASYENDAPVIWPWSNSDWRPSDNPVRNLVKAGALIAAEIDRLLRNPLTPPGADPAGAEGDAK